MQELPFLRSARRLMLIDICMKFREDSFRGFQVTERTRFVTDRRTDVPTFIFFLDILHVKKYPIIQYNKYPTIPFTFTD